MIRVTRTNSSPLQAILSSTFTTAHLNIITWNKAFSIFPVHTLIKHKFYPLKAIDNDFGLHLRELDVQGWGNNDLLWPDSHRSYVRKAIGGRIVGGKRTLIVKLNTESVQPSLRPDSVIDYAQFAVSYDSINYNEQARINQQGPFGRRIVSNLSIRIRKIST